MELKPDVVGDTLSEGRLAALIADVAACNDDAGTKDRDLNALGLTEEGADFFMAAG